MEKNILNKASELLTQCDVVTLASINEADYPRICVMVKVKAEGIQTIWMSTGTNSAKIAHFKKNPKASICYYLGDDSVTLLGKIEIIHDTVIKKELWQDWFIQYFPKGVNDPNYCILKFDTKEIACWFEKCFETHQICPANG